MKAVLNRKGQSTIEFILAVSFLLALVFFYLQLSMVMAYSSFVQYATFVSARAYFASSYDQADQTDRAQAVAVGLLKGTAGREDRWSIIAKGRGGRPAGLEIGPGDEFDRYSILSSWQEGVRYTFRSRVFLLPVPGAEGPGELDLTSESWLSREPTFQDCETDLRDRLGGVIYDNGC